MQADEQPFLFVGLGNPGPQYEMTRHNIGYMVVQEFAKSLSWSFKEDRRFNALVTKGIIEELTVHLMMPLTFMNLSGEAVRRYIDYFKLPLKKLVIIADDIALPYGQLRLRTMGGDGGHNGLKSIHVHLGTAHYMRLRMGIGHPGQKMLTDYVLDAFSATEKKELPALIDRGVEILKRLLKENPSHVMNSVNRILPQDNKGITPEKMSGQD